MADHEMSRTAGRDTVPRCLRAVSRAYAERLSDRLEALNRNWPPPLAPVVSASRQVRTIAVHRVAVAASALLGIIGIATATAAIDRLATSLWAKIETRGATVMIQLLDIPPDVSGTAPESELSRAITLEQDQAGSTRSG